LPVNYEEFNKKYNEKFAKDLLIDKDEQERYNDHTIQNLETE